MKCTHPPMEKIRELTRDGFHFCCQAAGGLASIRTKAMRQVLSPLLTQAWFVPC